MDEIDHVRGRKTVSIGKMDDIWIDLYTYDDTGRDRPLLGATANEICNSMTFDILMTFHTKN